MNVSRSIQPFGLRILPSQPCGAPIVHWLTLLPSALFLAGPRCSLYGLDPPLAGPSKWDRVLFLIGLLCELFDFCFFAHLASASSRNAPSSPPSHHRPQTWSSGFNSKVFLAPFSTLSSILVGLLSFTEPCKLVHSVNSSAEEARFQI